MTYDGAPTISITIRINGETRTLPGGMSVQELLTNLDLDPRAVVVELNRAIVRREALAEAPVRDGDQIELVHFVGGG